jgi:hypothetical protein
MRRAIIISAILLASCLAAQADQTVTEAYRDLIRPHGQPRGAAVSQAALDFCYGQTGDIRGLADTAAFKQCMLGRGYRWQKTSVKGRPAPQNGVDECVAMDMCQGAY